MKESAFKAKTKKRIREMFPDCYMHEMMTSTQGIPDTLILYGSKWALLEFKKSKDASHRPNQDYYVQKFGTMGFCDFIYPENDDYILRRLKDYFGG